MGHLPEFYVDQDLCTECGDCIKLIPQAFKKVEGEEVAEVHNWQLDDSSLPKVQKMMSDCPGKAILWRQK